MLRRAATPLTLLVSLAVAGLLHAACSRPPAAPTRPPERYAMRGEILRMPQAGEREIVIRHEAVPDLRDETGKVVGMEAMTMPFTLASDLPESSIAGLAPGDRIAFTLEMNWQASSDIARVISVEKLPAGTSLAWDPPAASSGSSAGSAPAAPGEKPSAGTTP